MTTVEKQAADAAGKTTLFLSSRVACLPGFMEIFPSSLKLDIIPLEEGAAAKRGVLLAQNLSAVQNLEEVPLISSFDCAVAVQPAGSASEPDQSALSDTPFFSSASRQGQAKNSRPTHLVFEGIAYRIGQDKFPIGRQLDSPGEGLQIPHEIPGIGGLHCLLMEEMEELLLQVETAYPTLLNQVAVSETTSLKAGDVLHLGEPPHRVELLLIHCSS